MLDLNYLPPIFKRNEWQKQFNDQGFVILEGLNRQQLLQARSATEPLLQRVKGKHRARFFPMAHSSDPGVRTASHLLASGIMLPLFEQHFDVTCADFYGGTHLVKPRGFHTVLGMHQDAALVDERIGHAVMAWCPLSHVHILNGAISVVIGSHKIDNRMRSSSIPWLFDGQQKLLKKYGKLIQMRAGQVLYFHSALIHGSGINFISSYRTAISAFITSRGTPFQNYFYNSITGKCDIYSADMNYFIHADFHQQPVDPYQLISCGHTLPERLSDERLRMELHRAFKLTN